MFLSCKYLVLFTGNWQDLWGPSGKGSLLTCLTLQLFHMFDDKRLFGKKKKKGKKEKNQLFTENVYRPKEDEDLERQLCFFLSVNLLKELFNCWINVIFSCQSAFFSPSQNIKIHVTGWFKALVMEHRRLVFGGFFHFYVASPNLLQTDSGQKSLTLGSLVVFEKLS